jgi:hypothetical protein
MPRTTKPANGATGSPRTKRPASGKSNGGANGVSDDNVARRAYEIYENRGANDGADLDDWLEAERQLKPGPTSVRSQRPPAPRKRKERKEPEGTGV